MELKKIWWIWILLIILLILIFPKTCGKANFISDTTEYKCGGLQAPFISLNNNPNSSYNWCYGICFEKSIKQKINQTGNQSAYQGENVPSFLSGTSDSLIKIIPGLILIIFIIVILRWIGSFKKNKSETIVYRTP